MTEKHQGNNIDTLSQAHSFQLSNSEQSAFLLWCQKEPTKQLSMLRELVDFQIMAMHQEENIQRQSMYYIPVAALKNESLIQVLTSPLLVKIHTKL